MQMPTIVDIRNEIPPDAERVPGLPGNFKQLWSHNIILSFKRKSVSQHKSVSQRKSVSQHKSILQHNSISQPNSVFQPKSVFEREVPGDSPPGATHFCIDLPGGIFPRNSRANQYPGFCFKFGFKSVSDCGIGNSK